jgi:hypothetical protein
MIICSCCNKQHKPIFEDNETQGIECSAEIYYDMSGKLLLAGFYGSTVADGHLYEVLTNTYKDGIICDSCIKAGLENFHFKLISTDNYF